MAPDAIPVQSRITVPAPTCIPLEGVRPTLRPISTGAAQNDNVISRPLGYRAKALTMVAPDSTYACGTNTDSVYIDTEEVSFSSTSPYGAQELPPGKALTIEECDPGWIHFGSPTKNQLVFVSYGGPSPTPPAAK